MGGRAARFTLDRNEFTAAGWSGDGDGGDGWVLVGDEDVAATVVEGLPTVPAADARITGIGVHGKRLSGSGQEARYKYAPLGACMTRALYKSV